MLPASIENAQSTMSISEREMQMWDLQSKNMEEEEVLNNQDILNFERKKDSLPIFKKVKLNENHNVVQSSNGTVQLEQHPNQSRNFNQQPKAFSQYIQQIKSQFSKFTFEANATIEPQSLEIKPQTQKPDQQTILTSTDERCVNPSELFIKMTPYKSFKAGLINRISRNATTDLTARTVAYEKRLSRPQDQRLHANQFGTLIH